MSNKDWATPKRRRRHQGRRRDPVARSLRDPTFRQRIRPGRAYDRERAEREARRQIEEDTDDES